MQYQAMVDVADGKDRKSGLLLLFWEWFKIALFVVGGGYAIIVVADEVFGRKRKWLREGELLEHLPVISSIPGLIAGNSAIYVGLKTQGRLGALAKTRHHPEPQKISSSKKISV